MADCVHVPVLVGQNHMGGGVARGLGTLWNKVICAPSINSSESEKLTEMRGRQQQQEQRQHYTVKSNLIKISVEHHNKQDSFYRNI